MTVIYYMTTYAIRRASGKKEEWISTETGIGRDSRFSVCGEGQMSGVDEHEKDDKSKSENLMKLHIFCMNSKKDAIIVIH